MDPKEIAIKTIREGNTRRTKYPIFILRSVRPEGAFGVRQLAAALGCQKSGSKLPHSKGFASQKLSGCMLVVVFVERQ